MIRREDLKKRGDTPEERRLRSKLEQVDMRDIMSIQEWVRLLIVLLGGIQVIKRDWPRRKMFDESLSSAEFDEHLAWKPFPRNFHVPMGFLAVNDVKMGDPDYGDLRMTEVIRGIVIREVREQLVDAVFPPRKRFGKTRRRAAEGPRVSVVIDAGRLIAPYAGATMRAANDRKDDGGGELH